MSGLLAYPPSEPRLVADTSARSRGWMHVASGSRRARARWQLAQSPRLGGWLWKPPRPEVEEAWKIGLSFLRQGPQPIVGVLSDSGPEQWLTLIPADDDVVVKVAVHPAGDAVIERERANLIRLGESPWRRLGPRARDDPRTSTAARAVILMDLLPGRHPKWDERRALADLVRALPRPVDRNGGPAGPSAALHHGDVTPWNVVVQDTGALFLVDWELAELTRDTHCVCGLLDFVLRGAVVARARPARVGPVLLDAVRLAGCEQRPRVEVVDLYRAYRRQVREVTGDRPDRLSHQADELLQICLAR
jgi:hypothetical protein